MPIGLTKARAQGGPCIDAPPRRCYDQAMTERSAGRASTIAIPAPDAPTTRSVGRPRRLTLSQILDAAIEMGLSGLKMSALAERLNVRVAVLYTYISGRAELVRLAAQRASGTAAFPEDEGQSWQDYAIQYAEAQYDLVVKGQLISILLNGDLSPAVKVDSVEQWLQVMLRRGFTASAALDLLRAIDVIVLGGAVLAAYMQAIAGDEERHRDLVRVSVARRSPDDIPNLSQHADLFAASAAPAWRSALALLLKGVADVRGSPGFAHKQ